jgi:hypothetical protein
LALGYRIEFNVRGNERGEENEENIKRHSVSELAVEEGCGEIEMEKEIRCSRKIVQYNDKISVIEAII